MPPSLTALLYNKKVGLFKVQWVWCLLPDALKEKEINFVLHNQQDFSNWGLLAMPPLHFFFVATPCVSQFLPVLPAQ